MKVAHFLPILPVDDTDAARHEALHASEATYEIGLALTVQPGNADDFAGIEREIDEARIVPHPPAFHPEHGRLTEPLGDSLRCQSLAALRAGDEFKYARFGDLFFL